MDNDKIQKLFDNLPKPSIFKRFYWSCTRKINEAILYYNNLIGNKLLYRRMCLNNIVLKSIKPTLIELHTMLDYTTDKYYYKYMSWYMSIEQNYWDPSEEIIALCILMNDFHNLIWDQKSKNWIKPEDNNDDYNEKY
jgi:hypothetical protein